MSYVTAWRLFEVAEDGSPKTLFHPFQGSRILPLDMPLRAEVREVWNPGKRNRDLPYLSGWHVAATREDIERYLDRFTANRTLKLCKVQVQKLRPKPRTRTRIKLAQTMKISSEDWDSAVTVKEKS